jgi:tetraacyldisaccharide 4'-kinase
VKASVIRSMPGGDGDGQLLSTTGIARTVRDLGRYGLAAWFQRLWYGSPPMSLPWPTHWLLSLSAELYHRGLRRHQDLITKRRRELPVFVISVGNLVVGGTGKTPFTLWLAKHLHSLGWTVAILSRGYKRKDAGIARVPLTGASFSRVSAFGDEPVLMAHRAKPVPVWVGKDRWTAGTLAIQRDGANVLILDDGFQHLALRRNLDLVMLDARKPLGNGALLPLGPLREPSDHLDRADAVVLSRADDPEQTANAHAKITGWFPEKPVFSCTHRLSSLSVGIDRREVPLEALRGKKVVAFAGIAGPEGFFHLLKEAGAVVEHGFSFPDHHHYRETDLLMLLKAMEDCASPFLITTEKDMVRLPPALQAFTLAVLLELDFGSQHQAFCEFLREKLPPR